MVSITIAMTISTRDALANVTTMTMGMAILKMPVTAMMPIVASTQELLKFAMVLTTTAIVTWMMAMLMWLVPPSGIPILMGMHMGLVAPPSRPAVSPTCICLLEGIVMTTILPSIQVRTKFVGTVLIIIVMIMWMKKQPLFPSFLGIRMVMKMVTGVPMWLQRQKC